MYLVTLRAVLRALPRNVRTRTFPRAYRTIFGPLVFPLQRSIATTTPAQLLVVCRSISTTPSRHIVWKLPILYAGWKGLVWGLRMLNTPLARAVSLFSKKVVQIWKLPAEERRALWSSVSAKRKIFYGVSVVLSVVMGVAYYEHIEETPITKRRRFIALTREQVDTMVNTERDNILQMMAKNGALLPESHGAHQLVQTTLTQLLSSNQSPDLAGLSCKVHVFDNPDLISAYSLPTGDIIVYTGLVNACRSTEELSFVLGHEVAHYVLGHKTEHLSKWAVVNFFTDFLNEFWEVAESTINSFRPLRLFQHKVVEVLLTYPYSDEMEKEADQVGLTMAARACYDPVKACGVWTNIKGEEAKGEKKVIYLTLHPCDEHRHGNIAGLLPGACAVWKGSGCAARS